MSGHGAYSNAGSAAANKVFDNLLMPAGEEGDAQPLVSPLLVAAALLLLLGEPATFFPFGSFRCQQGVGDVRDT